MQKAPARRRGLRFADVAPATAARRPRDVIALRGDSRAAQGHHRLVHQGEDGLMSLFLRAFPKWLPIGVAVTLVLGIGYLSVQQSYRMGANDPQIQMARDTAAGIAAGTPADQLVPTQKVDPSQSLAPFVIVLDVNGKVVVSSMTLAGTTPIPPQGVLDSAKASGESRVTWQPRADARIASVVVAVKGGTGGWVVAGRSLAAVEERIDQLTQMAALGLLGTLIVTFGAVLLADRMGERSGERGSDRV
jgi:hypothetical protein